MKTYKLSDLAKIQKGTSITKKGIFDGNIPVIAWWQNPAYYTNISNRNWPVITISASWAYAGFVNFFTYPIFASDCVTIEPLEQKEVDVKYLFMCLKWKQQGIYRLQRWAGQPHVYGSDIWKLQIPLPPLPEQQAIAARLDEIQELIDLRCESLVKLEEYSKSLFLDMFGDIMASPKKWEIKTLEDLLEDKKNLSYGIVQAWDEIAWGVKVLRPVDIVDDVLYLNEVKSVSPNIERKYLKTRLKGWEVLMVVRWATWWVVIAPEKCNGFNVTRGLAVIKTKWVNTIYLCKYFQSQEAQNYIQEHTRWATLKQINLWDLRVMNIPIPPLHLQQEFASRIEQVNVLKSDYQASLDKLTELYQATMQQYFG